MIDLPSLLRFGLVSGGLVLGLVSAAAAPPDPQQTPLVARAEAALSAPLFTVMEKRLTPPSGDRHDYYALSPYHWPDPDKPDGRPYLFRDGQVNPAADSDDYDRRAYFRMGDAVAYLAVAYDITGDPRFAAGAARWLRAWFVAPETRMNPHLRFAQCIPGEPAGLPIGIIRGMTLIDVARAERLLSTSATWTKADSTAVQQWMRTYLRWLCEDPLALRESRATNNHGTWYDAQVASLALYLGDRELARSTVEQAATSRVARQVAPDGRQPLEMLRTKSWDYCVMNLEALVVLAEVGRATGFDLWNFASKDGRSLRGALDFLLSFAVGENTWPMKQIKSFQPERLAPALERAAVVFPKGPYAEARATFAVPEAETLLRCRLLAVPFAAD